MENIYKEVDFKTYCKTCEHKDLEEKFDPCNDCLAEPMNANSDNLFTGRRLKMVDSILVSVDFSNKNDTGVMVVGRKRMNQSVEIINAFQGDEARELYERLITTKKKEGQK